MTYNKTVHTNIKVRDMPEKYDDKIWSDMIYTPS